MVFATAKIETMAVALLRYASKHRRWVRFGALRSFYGTAVSTTLSVPQARYRTQSLFLLLGPLLRAGAGGRPRGRDVRLSHQGVAGLRWWAKLTTRSLIGRALWPQPHDVVLHTDASLSGWGVVWNGTVPARGVHTPDRRHLQINVLELGAVRQALQSFVDLLRTDKDTVVRLVMNSLVSVHVINNSTSRSAAMLRELRFLKKWCERHGVHLRASHIPSAVNFAADRLSRVADSTEWSLSDRAFHRLEDQYGPHTVDLFATSVNHKCGHYYSATADPGTAGVDALTHDWVGDNCWANPPFQLMGVVVDKILRSRAQVTLVAPVWRTQPWWSLAVAGCSSWEDLLPHEGVFTHDSHSTPAATPKWRVAVFRFDGADTPCRA